MEKISILFAILIFFSCKKSTNIISEGLTKVTDQELIERAKNQDWPNPETIIVKGSKGEIIGMDSLMNLDNPMNYFSDYYQDENGVIKEASFRVMTEKDKALIKRIEAVMNTSPEIKTVAIDCENREQLLSEVHDKDQNMRMEGQHIDPAIDHENLEMIVSLLDQCGMPTRKEVSQKAMTGLWAVLQHAPPEYQSKYIPLLEEAADRGDLSYGKIALMKDRALMYAGEPQIYGSQVMNGKLHELTEPEYVDQRRAEIGMEPLKQYLQRFDIEFTVEQKTK